MRTVGLPSRPCPCLFGRILLAQCLLAQESPAPTGSATQRSPEDTTQLPLTPGPASHPDRAACSGDPAVRSSGRRQGGRGSRKKRIRGRQSGGTVSATRPRVRSRVRSSSVKHSNNSTPTRPSRATAWLRNTLVPRCSAAVIPSIVPSILQNQSWTELLGVSGVYDTGVIRVANPDGSPGNPSLVGVRSQMESHWHPLFSA